MKEIGLTIKEVDKASKKIKMAIFTIFIREIGLMIHIMEKENRHGIRKIKRKHGLQSHNIEEIF